MSPKCINDLFEIPNKRCDLSNADFTIPRYKTVKYGKHSLRYLGSFIWTRLNGKETTVSNIHTFRNCIKLYLKTIYAMNIVGSVNFLEFRLFNFIYYFYRLIRFIKKTIAKFLKNDCM